MVGASKILTVSYGTFSCTLEGFDEPFSTMKAIAEYFRDLAADDRYFGAEPPIPDAEMLHRIAEREIQRRVEAKISEHGVVLRQTETATAPLAMPETARVAAPVAPVATPMAPAMPAFTSDADDFANDYANDFDGAADAALFGDAVVAAPVSIPAAAVPPVAVPSAAVPPVAVPPVARLVEGDADAEGIAAKLMRIRAVVEGARQEAPEALRPQMAYEDEEDASPSFVANGATPADDFGFELDLGSSFDAADVMSADDGVAEAVDAAVTQALADDAAEEISEAEYVGEVEAEAVEAEAEESEAEEIEVEAEAEEAAAPEEALTPELDVLVLDASAAVAPETPQAEPWAEAEDEAFAEDEAEAESEAYSDEDFEDDEDLDAEEIAEAELEEEDIAELAVGAEDVAEDDVAEDLDEEEGAFAAEADEEEAPEAFAGTEAEEHADESLSSLMERTRARIISIGKSVQAATLGEAAHPAAPTEEAPAPESQTVPHDESDSDAALLAEIGAALGETGLSAEAEADLARQLAEVARDSVKRDAHEGRAILEEAAQDDEAALSRLMDEAASKLEGVESRRRFSAIAHLKAAVVATVADRKLKQRDAASVASETETEIARYREDLSKAVRPRRQAPEAASTTRRPTLETRPAPLVLVSELRVDRPTDAMDDGAVVRPRRIHAGNLAVFEDDDDLAMDEPISPEEARNFADFAESIGATDLASLLEAAAVYTATVEGRPHFSRPHLLDKVARVSEDPDYSREDGMRSFGMLLRQGKIQKVRRGRFTITEASRLMSDARRAQG